VSERWLDIPPAPWRLVVGKHLVRLSRALYQNGQAREIIATPVLEGLQMWRDSVQRRQHRKHDLRDCIEGRFVDGE